MEKNKVRYLGKCNKCDCEFRTFVKFEVDDEGHRTIVPVDYLKNLAISDDGQFVTCNCPVCDRTFIELHKI